MKTWGGKIFIAVAVSLAQWLSLVSFGQTPRNPQAVEQVKTGIELKKKGDLVGAEAHYREAILLDPRYAEAHYNYAILLDQRGDLSGAISECKKAIDIEKNY